MESGGGVAHGAHGAHANPLLVLHRCLRGRYLLAVVLAGVLSLPAAVVGYIAMPPKYTSAGVVNIAPTKPQLLYETELTSPMYAFDSFVQSQANTLRSARVLDLAISNPKLSEAGWPMPPDGLVELSRSLRVDVPSRGQDIFVFVSHENPRLSQAAVNAVLEGFEQIAVDRELLDLEGKIRELEQLRDTYRNRAEQTRDQAFRIAAAEGAGELDERIRAENEQLVWLKKLILETEIQLLPYEGIAAGDGEGGEAPQQLSPELLAQTDREMARLLEQRRSLETEVAALEQRFAPGHRQIQQRRDDLAAVNTMIEARVTLGSGAAASASGAQLSPTVLARQLRAQLDRLRQMYGSVASEAQRLAGLQAQIQELRAESGRFDRDYQAVDNRLQALTVERRDGQVGRISVTQRGDLPIEPSSDRRIPLAVIGAMGGAALGLGIVTVIGLVWPKFRYIDDLEGPRPNVFVFGAVPELISGDAVSREMVAASVHQVRSMIDARLLGTSSEALVHLITSASAGEGKSTISMRLAKSFAATGRRTLLIDSDMIGRRLSAEFKMMDAPGFAEAITHTIDPLAGVYETSTPDLLFMPGGRPDAAEPEQISANHADTLLRRLRREFQTIIVDSGPVLGSLEAQAIASSADEVLLVVSRGKEVRMVKLAIERLRRLGAARIGVIFNRATRADVERSTSISLTSQRVTQARGPWAGRGDNGEASGSRDGAREPKAAAE